VPALARLGAADLDGALGVVREAATAEGEQPFELPVIDRLALLVPADRCGYFEYRNPGPPHQDLYNVKQPFGAELRWESEELTAALPFWDLADQQQTPFARRFGDNLTRAQRLRNPWYVEVMRPVGLEHEMKLWLPAPTGWVRGFFFNREAGRRNFNERDRAVLTALRPHLGLLRERWQQRHRPAGLTDREIELLRLVRQGLTNREIADRLVISTGTIRTHLENIFEKLEVHTRTGAVARAFGVNQP
jgi:DNA-binding CsgD family transcriptional regulator